MDQELINRIRAAADAAAKKDFGKKNRELDGLYTDADKAAQVNIGFIPELNTTTCFGLFIMQYAMQTQLLNLGALRIIAIKTTEGLQ